MHNHRDTLVAWLKDAHSMEKGLVPVLENHAKDAKAHPQVSARIEQHKEETKRHAELVEKCLHQLGEKPSAAKSALGAMFGRVQAPMTGMSKDELVKNGIADYATENFEIASYEALIVAAEAAGEPEIAQTCRTILEDEKRMAEFLHQQLPVAVREHIAGGVPA